VTLQGTCSVELAAQAARSSKDKSAFTVMRVCTLCLQCRRTCEVVGIAAAVGVTAMSCVGVVGEHASMHPAAQIQNNLQEQKVSCSNR
jgi:hypothetical protein